MFAYKFVMIFTLLNSFLINTCVWHEGSKFIFPYTQPFVPAPSTEKIILSLLNYLDTLSTDHIRVICPRTLISVPMICKSIFMPVT